MNCIGVILVLVVGVVLGLPKYPLPQEVENTVSCPIPAQTQPPLVGGTDPDNYGCKDNLCWTECRGALASPDLILFPIAALIRELGGTEWCYSTKTYSQSGDYVKCKTKKDCCAAYRCGGACTV